MSTRVLLVDDHQVVRDGLRSYLKAEADITVVGEAENGAQAIDAARTLQPDIVIMDITMPDLNGVGATKEILRLNDDTEVIALSMQADKRFVIEMLEAGASGYVTKHAPMEEVVLAIRAAMSGKKYLSPDIAHYLIEDRLNSSEGVSSNTKTISNREREVLQLVAEGKSTKEIANFLHLSEKTVSGHRQSIMTKLGLHSIAALTKYAIREGLTDVTA